MTVLQIEHKVPDFGRWKKAFDEDPIDRKGSGVRRYEVFRPVDDPGYVIINLYFGEREQATKALEKLRSLWGVVEGTVMTGPKTRILDLAETVEV